MATDVRVTFRDGRVVTFPKIDRITESRSFLRLEVKRYSGVTGRVISTGDMKHVVSIPYSAMEQWTEED